MPVLKPGDRVRVYNPNRKWKEPATVVEKAENARSYHVLTDRGSRLTRNRHHLLKSAEAPRIRLDPDLDLDLDLEILQKEQEVAAMPARTPPTEPNQVVPPPAIVGPPMPSTPVAPKRSSRVTKRPDRLIESI